MKHLKEKHYLLFPMGMLIGMMVWMGMPVEGWSAIQYHWVQMIGGQTRPGGAVLPVVSVRLVVDNSDACQNIQAYKDVKMTDKLPLSFAERPKRGAVQSSGFAEIKVCEYVVVPPNDTLLQGFHTLYLTNGAGGKPVAVLLPDLSHGGLPVSQLITAGCSGCRDDATQYCADKAPKGEKKSGKSDKSDKKEKKADSSGLPWLYGEMNSRAVQEAGKGGDLPPLWIHLGDMRYSGQTAGVADAWSQSKDSSGEEKLGWKEEFFDPTAPLMQKGFSVVLRGNHEFCFVGKDKNKKWQDRGEGWFYFFGTGTDDCATALAQQGALSPFAFDAVVYGGSMAKPEPTAQSVRLVMMDTVIREDVQGSEQTETTALYKQRYDTVAATYFASVNKPGWIFEHIPAYELGKKQDTDLVTTALKSSNLGSRFAQIPLVVSAHVHNFNLIQTTPPTATQPTQITVGNGGVALTAPGKSAMGESCEFKQAGLLELQSVNFGYLQVQFAVKGGKVKAIYETPLFAPTPSPLKPDKAVQVVCKGHADQPFQPVCTVNKQPACP